MELKERRMICWFIAFCPLVALAMWHTTKAKLPIVLTPSQVLDSPRPCPAMFKLVKMEMTKKDVIATVGAPPGNYCNKTSSQVRLLPCGLGYLKYSKWVTDEGELLVLFDNDDRVLDVRIWDVLISQE